MIFMPWNEFGERLETRKTHSDYGLKSPLLGYLSRTRSLNLSRGKNCRRGPFSLHRAPPRPAHGAGRGLSGDHGHVVGGVQTAVRAGGAHDHAGAGLGVEVKGVAEAVAQLSIRSDRRVIR